MPLGELMDARADAKRRRTAVKFLRPGEAAEAIFPAQRVDERSRNILAVSSLTLSAVIAAGLILFRSHYLVVTAVLLALMAGHAALIRRLAPWRIVVVTPQRILVLTASVWGSRARKVLSEVPSPTGLRRADLPGHVVWVGGEMLRVPVQHVAEVDRALYGFRYTAQPRGGTGYRRLSRRGTSARPGWRPVLTIVVLVAAAAVIFKVTMPKPPSGVKLSAVSSGTGSSTWAAGWSCSSCGATDGIYRTVILRRHGTSWSQVPSPSPGNVATLRAISAGPAGAAWAVGWSCVSGCLSGAENDRTLILRWNGATWSLVPSPSPGSASLGAVSAGQSGTAWAAGWQCTSRCGHFLAGDRTLILRWNGSTWSQVPSPSPGSAILRAVSAGQGGTAWAAGWYCTSRCGGPSPVVRTLIQHWNGSTWSRVPSPTPGIYGGLEAISAAQGDTAWAAGYYCASSCGTTAPDLRTLVLRWNGTAWSEVPSPSPGLSATLSSVQATAGASAWAVGSSCVSSCGSTTSESDRMLILHWNGATWSQVTIAGSGSTFLAGLAIAPDGTAWAVGGSCSQYCDTTAQADHILILRWNKATWSISPP